MTEQEDIVQEQWYCLRTQLKREHIAAANLRSSGGVRVFNPKIKHRKPTRRGPVWTTEALFPSYIFARFPLDSTVDLVQHTPGVRNIVRFGPTIATVPDDTIDELISQFGADEMVTVSKDLQEGDKVTVVEGPFLGIEGEVLALLPAKDRVRILLEFLGRASKVELPRLAVAKQEADFRKQIFEENGTSSTNNGGDESA